jgi:hypothetical protein
VEGPWEDQELSRPPASITLQRLPKITIAQQPSEDEVMCICILPAWKDNGAEVLWPFRKLRLNFCSRAETHQ